MNKLLSASIAASRRLLKNPYAYLDEFGGYSALPNSVAAKPSEITISRQIFENPYAHLDGAGGFSAIANDYHEINALKKDRYSLAEIEWLARDLQTRMWKDRGDLWPGIESHNPITILDPLMALRLIGYDTDTVETLGQYRIGDKQVEVAGVINRSPRQVHISKGFPINIRNFTAAHELGHAVLHQTSGLHRDRPLDGSMIARDSTEYEADKFAAYFLMPSKLVQGIFKQFFRADKFVLDEATAFALGMDYEELASMSLRQLTKIIAATERYNGLQFNSIANQFCVSVGAMAIRLEELELVVR